MKEYIYAKESDTLLKPVQELVRCKDCRFSDVMISDVLRPCKHNLCAVWVKDNDFCSRGERREREEE